MEENKQPTGPSVQIHSQFIKDLSFEAPGMPFEMATLKSAPKIAVDIDVKVNKTEKENLFTVDLHINTVAKKADEDKTLFLCELEYGSLVSLNVPKEHMEPILIVEVPHLLFPFARAIIANITRESGLPPLQINPIDFAALYRSKLNTQQPEQKN